MSNRSGQRWVFMRHGETGGSTWVPDDPDVVSSHEQRGWYVALPPDGVSKGPARAAESRKNRSSYGRSRSGSLLVLEFVCAPDGFPGHGAEVIARIGRDLVGVTRGTFIFGRGGRWTTAGESNKLAAECTRCGFDFQRSRQAVEAMMDAMVIHTSATPTTWRYDVRRQRLLR
jgi:hypothetical protein